LIIDVASRMVVGFYLMLEGNIGQGRYICSVRYPRSAPEACPGRSVQALSVETHVWAYVSGLLADPDLLRERERIERKVAAMEREISRLIDACQARMIDLSELKERRAQIEDHGRLLQNRLGEIHRQRLEREQELRLLQGLEGFAPASATHSSSRLSRSSRRFCGWSLIGSSSRTTG
jgi:hypothetical protein